MRRALTELDECRAVVDLQIEVWGKDSEVVPASVLFVSAKSGGILIGEFDDATGRLVGFVWSMPGWKNAQPFHWSHMLGVSPSARGKGIGEALKWAQAERARQQGVDLIEWTFDPLQAPNAHLNFTRLGASSGTYLVDAYGEMTGPLHRGTATDRLIAEWRLSTAGGHSEAWPTDFASPIVVRQEGPWLAVESVDTSLDAPAIIVPVPARFTDLQRESRDLAGAWRAATREVFTRYFSRGYRAVGFSLDRNSGAGSYLLRR